MRSGNDQSQLVPRWMPVALAAATIIGTTGSTYATFGLRIANLETRTEHIDSDRAARLEDYGQFKQKLASELQELRDGQHQQSAALSRISERLGILQ